MGPKSGKLLSDEETIERFKKNGEWGLLTSVDLHDCDPEKIRDGDYIRKFSVDLCDHIDMKRYGEPIVVRFGADPRVQGYSLAQLIETSLIPVTSPKTPTEPSSTSSAARNILPRRSLNTAGNTSAPRTWNIQSLLGPDHLNHHGAPRKPLQIPSRFFITFYQVLRHFPFRPFLTVVGIP